MAGSPLFKETVSSLSQPPETSLCETWFLSSLSFSSVGQCCVRARCFTCFFPEELDLYRLWVQAGSKENFIIFCTAYPGIKCMKNWWALLGLPLWEMSGHKGRSKMHWSKTCPLCFECHKIYVLCFACEFLCTYSLCQTCVFPCHHSQALRSVKSSLSPPAGNVHFSPCSQLSFPF